MVNDKMEVPEQPCKKRRAIVSPPLSRRVPSPLTLPSYLAAELEQDDLAAVRAHGHHAVVLGHGGVVAIDRG